jgi:hypothetical protein
VTTLLMYANLRATSFPAFMALVAVTNVSGALAALSALAGTILIEREWYLSSLSFITGTLVEQWVTVQGGGDLERASSVGADGDQLGGPADRPGLLAAGPRAVGSRHQPRVDSGLCGCAGAVNRRLGGAAVLPLRLRLQRRARPRRAKTAQSFGRRAPAASTDDRRAGRGRADAGVGLEGEAGR